MSEITTQDLVIGKSDYVAGIQESIFWVESTKTFYHQTVFSQQFPLYSLLDKLIHTKEIKPYKVIEWINLSCQPSLRIQAMEIISHIRLI